MKFTWADDIETALRNLGGEAHLSEIYPEVRRIRSEAGRSVPPRLKPTIRGRLECHSRASDTFTGVERFVMVSKGSGMYCLVRASDSR